MTTARHGISRARHEIGTTGDAREGDAGADRGRILPRLLPVGSAEVADVGRAGRARILRLLARALRSERVRGRDGHWSYSLDRHVALVQAMAMERRGWLEAFGERWSGRPETASPLEAAGNANRRGPFGPRRS